MTARLVSGAPLQLGGGTFLQRAIQTLIDHPDLVLLVDTANGRELTARELHQKASAISHKLSELGVGQGDIIMMLSNATVEAFILMLGVWLAGAAFTCVNPFLPIEDIKMFFEQCQIKVAYGGEIAIDIVKKAVDELGKQIKIIAPNGKYPVLDLLEIMEQPVDLITTADQPLGGEHRLSVYFTSGTTGVPKGVVQRDITYHFACVGVHKYFSGPKPLTSSPLYWVSSAVSWASCLMYRTTLYIADRPNPEQFLKIITKYKPSHFFSGPSFLLDMCKVPRLDSYDTSSLTNVSVGGSVLFPEQRQMIGERLFNNRHIVKVGYGSTEAGGLISIEKVQPSRDSPQYNSMGQLIDGNTVKVIDMNTGEIVPPFTPGEICVKSPGVLKSYINKEITESELDKDGFFHMGDIGYYDEDDYLYYVSRKKDVMKYKGQQIAPAELEIIIQKHPDVVESAVVGKPDPECGDLPAAFVVLKPNSTLTEQELFDFVSDSVIDEKKLRGGIYFVENLPRNAVGKILRNDLINTLTT